MSLPTSRTSTFCLSQKAVIDHFLSLGSMLLVAVQLMHTIVIIRINLALVLLLLAMLCPSVCDAHHSIPWRELPQSFCECRRSLSSLPRKQIPQVFLEKIFWVKKETRLTCSMPGCPCHLGRDTRSAEMSRLVSERQTASGAVGHLIPELGGC